MLLSKCKMTGFILCHGHIAFHGMVQRYGMLWYGTKSHTKPHTIPYH